MILFLYFSEKLIKMRRIFYFLKNLMNILKVNFWLLNRIQRGQVKVIFNLIINVSMLIVVGGSLIQSAFVNLNYLWLGLSLFSFLCKLCNTLKLLRFRIVHKEKLIKLLKHLKVCWSKKKIFRAGKKHQRTIKIRKIMLNFFNLF